MKAMVIRAPAGFEIPETAIILWYGISTELPVGFEIFAELNGFFPRGGSTYSATPLGNAAHVHTYGATAVTLDADHTHTVTNGSVSDTVSTVNTAYGGDSTAAPSHSHSKSGNVTAAGGHRHTIADTGSASLLPAHKKYYYIRRTA